MPPGQHEAGTQAEPGPVTALQSALALQGAHCARAAQNVPPDTVELQKQVLPPGPQFLVKLLHGLRGAPQIITGWQVPPWQVKSPVQVPPAQHN